MTFYQRSGKDDVGTPAGSDGEVQFNASGSFGASSNLYWDNSNIRLGVGMNSPTYAIDVETSSFRMLRLIRTSNLTAALEFGNTLGTTIFGRPANSGKAFAIGPEVDLNVTPYIYVLETSLTGINTASPTAQLHVQSSSASAKGLIVQGAASQTSNMLEVQDSTGTADVVVDSDGNVGIGTTSPTGKLDINDDVVRVRTSKTPASASATGNQGEIAWDSNYIYICTATDTWKRVAIATW